MDSAAPAVASSRTHNRYSPAYKLQVIKLAEERSKHYASRICDIDRKRVREWCKNKAKIQEMFESQKSCETKMPNIWLESQKVYNAEFKHHVAKEALEKGTKYVSEAYHVDKRRIRDWMKSIDKLSAAVEVSRAKSKLSKPPLFKKADLEAAVVEWYKESIKAGVNVTIPDLKEAAIKIYHENRIGHFKASDAWIYSLKKKFPKVFDPSFSNTSSLFTNRKIYTLDFKIEVAEVAEENGTAHASEKYNLGKRLVRQWKQMKDRFIALQKSHSMPTDVNDILINWCKEFKLSHGISVSAEMLKAEAEKLYNDHGFEHFQATDQWLCDFCNGAPELLESVEGVEEEPCMLHLIPEVEIVSEEGEIEDFDIEQQCEEIESESETNQNSRLSPVTELEIVSADGVIKNHEIEQLQGITSDSAMCQNFQLSPTDLNEGLIKWCKNFKNARGVQVSLEDLRNEAESIYRNNGFENFYATNEWLQGFQDRAPELNGIVEAMDMEFGFSRITHNSEILCNASPTVLNESLINWCKNFKNDRGVAASSEELRNEAERLYRENGFENFCATNEWIQGFVRIVEAMDRKIHTSLEVQYSETAGESSPTNLNESLISITRNSEILCNASPTVLNERLINWCKNFKNDRGVAVSSEKLRDKAERLYRKNGFENFCATNEWIQGFVGIVEAIDRKIHSSLEAQYSETAGESSPTNLNESLINWCKKLKDVTGAIVSLEELKHEAERLYRQNGFENFYATNEWLQGFQDRAPELNGIVEAIDLKICSSQAQYSETAGESSPTNLNETLINWCKNLENVTGTIVTLEELKHEAERLYRKNGFENFYATNEWLQGFQDRAPELSGIVEAMDIAHNSEILCKASPTVLNKSLINWCKNFKISYGDIVPSDVLRNEAERLYRENGFETFYATDEWLQGFQDRAPELIGIVEPVHIEPCFSSVVYEQDTLYDNDTN